MSKTFKIYTVGKMKDISYTKQMEWRLKIANLIKSKTEKRISFVHPPLFYNYEQKDYKSEREIKEWELNQVKQCDILIVNLDGINDSIGSHFEISAAETINTMSDKHIYIIGIGQSKEQLNPWIELSLFRQEHDFENAARYIADYLLI